MGIYIYIYIYIQLAHTIGDGRYSLTCTVIGPVHAIELERIRQKSFFPEGAGS